MLSILSESVPEDFLPLFNVTFSSDVKSSSVSSLFVLLLPASQLSRTESPEASRFLNKSYQGFKLERADWKVHDVVKGPAIAQQSFSSAKYPTT
ncbi:uncharacterized protein HD556DRAFT_1441451 [Suillus plorans]|uniref:Uncharacterized protein n=1 Tax=Suillus plorans TaxID=116603 RepID=A0A9P7IXX4_9AGAM|nr:uncharacterized protein HD556DRAFT_1441451 [Suillus plorans]KAG1796753.1 hypothetical protein HD556DRAFT_1441451 [Suillus plorans]